MQNRNLVFSILLAAFAASGIVLISGCKSDENAKNPSAASKPEEKHEAHHGGCLNAIETCAVGHAEVKLDGDVLKVWFVGGENETDKAVRVTDKQIALAVKPDGGQEKSLTLEARPIEPSGGDELFAVR